MQAMKTVLWFVDNNANAAACQALETAGIRIETKYSETRMPHREGILQHDKISIRIILYPTIGAQSHEAIELARVATRIFLTGALAGRPGQVKLGDVIANRGCYHIDLGAERKMNGSVIHNFSPLFATKETEAALRALQFERLECDKPFPVALHTRRDWVLD